MHFVGIGESLQVQHIVWDIVPYDLQKGKFPDQIKGTCSSCLLLQETPGNE